MKISNIYFGRMKYWETHQAIIDFGEYMGDEIKYNYFPTYKYDRKSLDDLLEYSKNENLGEWVIKTFELALENQSEYFYLTIF